MLNAGLKQAKTGVLGWFKQLFARQTPSQVNVNVDTGNLADAGAIPMGPVGKEFSGLARVVMVRDDKSLLRGYMDSLSKVRTRFNLIKNQGDPGPGARQLMQRRRFLEFVSRDLHLRPTEREFARRADFERMRHLRGWFYGNSARIGKDLARPRRTRYRDARCIKLKKSLRSGAFRRLIRRSRRNLV